MGDRLVAEGGMVSFPEEPEIPGLSYRRFQVESDVEAIFTILVSSAEADHTERVYTLEEVQRLLASQREFDLHRDLLFAEVDGQVIGYARVSWDEELDGNRLYRMQGGLLPAWRRMGIGGALLIWSEARLREIAASHGDVPHRYFQTYAEDTEAGKIALLERDDYTQARHFITMIHTDLESVNALPIPAGLEVRPVLPEHYRTVLMAMDEAFRDHWGHVPLTEDMIAFWLGDPHFDASLWQVAWAAGQEQGADQVAGMVMAYIDIHGNKLHHRKRGVTEPIAVRRPWRRIGLARSLLVKSLLELRKSGTTEAVLHVDTNNPSGALRLYESTGFKVMKKAWVYRKPMNETPTFET